MFVFLGLGYLRVIVFSSINLPTNFMLLYFYQLSNTPFCKGTVFFFNYFLVEGHLDCFQFLVIMNNASVSIVDKCSSGRMEQPLGLCTGVA